MTVLRMDNVGIAMMGTPDRHSKLELMSYQKPSVIVIVAVAEELS